MMYNTIAPQATRHQQTFDLTKFQLAPGWGCCFYSSEPVPLDLGAIVKGQVAFTYPSTFPENEPSFILVSVSQLTIDNGKSSFADRVAQSGISNMTRYSSERKLVFTFLFADIQERSNHYFVLNPQSLGQEQLAKMEVTGEIQTYTTSSLPILLAGTLGIAGTLITTYAAIRRK